jgi:hypothetical protein
MHQAAVNHIMAFRRMGAEKYVRTLREREQEEEKDGAAKG